MNVLCVHAVSTEQEPTNPRREEPPRPRPTPGCDDDPPTIPRISEMVAWATKTTYLGRRRCHVRAVRPTVGAFRQREINAISASAKVTHRVFRGRRRRQGYMSSRAGALHRVLRRHCPKPMRAAAFPGANRNTGAFLSFRASEDRDLVVRRGMPRRLLRDDAWSPTPTTQQAGPGQPSRSSCSFVHVGLNDHGIVKGRFTPAYGR